MVESVVQQSMLRRAVEQEKVDLHCINLRDFGKSNYRQIDDTPFGGGVGMVMMAKPLFEAIDHATELVGGTEPDLPVASNTTVPSENVQPTTQSVDYESMTKAELEVYGRSIGIELDRRQTKDTLISQLVEANK